MAVVVAMVAMIAPEPEAGESRFAWGDLPFVLLVVLFVTGLAWLSHLIARRFLVRRRDGDVRGARASDPHPGQHGS